MMNRPTTIHDVVDQLYDHVLQADPALASPEVAASRARMKKLLPQQGAREQDLQEALRKATEKMDVERRAAFVRRCLEARDQFIQERNLRIMRREQAEEEALSEQELRRAQGLLTQQRDAAQQNPQDHENSAPPRPAFMDSLDHIVGYNQQMLGWSMAFALLFSPVLFGSALLGAIMREHPEDAEEWLSVLSEAMGKTANVILPSGAQAKAGQPTQNDDPAAAYAAQAAAAPKPAPKPVTA